MEYQVIIYTSWRKTTSLRATFPLFSDVLLAAELLQPKRTLQTTSVAKGYGLRLCTEGSVKIGGEHCAEIQNLTDF